MLTCRRFLQSKLNKLYRSLIIRQILKFAPEQGGQVQPLLAVVNLIFTT